MKKKPGFIQLKAANLHPEERHLKDIQKIGLKGVEEFAGFVADHFDGTYKGNIPGHYLFAMSNERRQGLGVPDGSHGNALVVEAFLIWLRPLRDGKNFLRIRKTCFRKGRRPIKPFPVPLTLISGKSRLMKNNL